MARGIVDVYPGCHFNITIANFDRADVNLPKYQNGCEVLNAPQQIVYVEEESFSYSSGAKVGKSDSAINARY